MTRCANRECPVPAGQRLTQPCLLNTGGMPDVIGSPCDGFVAAEPPKTWWHTCPECQGTWHETVDDGPNHEPGCSLAQPPVECKHEDVLVSIKGSAFRHPMSGEATCADCDAPMVVRPAAQWAAVEALVAEWESNVPEGNDKGVLGGMYAGCARQLRKALGLERVTKGEGL